MVSGAHALKTAKRGAAAVVLLSTKTNFKNSKGGPAPIFFAPFRRDAVPAEN
jgi:hypothetical protein